jgi:pyruvate dehydrogenase (quinone)
VNNGELGQILWEQMVLGYPEFGVRYQQRANFAPWAAACGAYGRTIEHPADLEGAVKEVFAEPGPALLDVWVNPDEPPMPPKVTYEQAKGFVESFLKGQPRRMSIASTVFRDKLDRFKS